MLPAIYVKKKSPQGLHTDALLLDFHIFSRDHSQRAFTPRILMNEVTDSYFSENVTNTYFFAENRWLVQMHFGHVSFGGCMTDIITPLKFNDLIRKIW